MPSKRDPESSSSASPLAARLVEPPPWDLNRIQALAWDTSWRNHERCADDTGEGCRDGHTGPHRTCPHPDCVIVSAGRLVDPRASLLVEAAQQAFVILEGLRLSVDWELAPPIKQKIAEVATQLSHALSAARLVDPPLEQETWFQNLIVGVRGLVQNHASRHSRPHLLAAIDEAARRLQAGRLVDPSPQPEDSKGRFLLNAYGRQCWDLGFQAAESAAATAVDPSPPDIERELRMEWWLNHGLKCMPYGDDGEMQCCGLDFKRMPLDQLRPRVNELRLRRISESIARVDPSPLAQMSIDRYRYLLREHNDSRALTTSEIAELFEALRAALLVPTQDK